MKKLITLLILISLLCQVVAFSDESIDTRRSIKIAYSVDSYPFHFQNEAGEADGYIIDYWNLWAEKMNIDIEFNGYSWNDAMASVQNGENDIFAGAFYNEARDQIFDYGQPIVDVTTHIFYSNAISSVDSLSDLGAFNVGVIAGDFAVGFLQENAPETSIITYETYEDILSAIKDKEIQVFVGDTMSVMRTVEEEEMTFEINYSTELPIYSEIMYGITRDGNKEVVDLMQVGHQKIRATEIASLNEKWFEMPLRDRVTVAISLDYEPLSFINANGEPEGFLVDIWKLWGAKTNTEVQFYINDWTNTLEAIKTGVADIHSGLFVTDDRLKYMDFSSDFYRMKTAVYINRSLDVSSLEEFPPNKFGVVEGTFQEQYIASNYPYLDLVKFTNSASMYESGTTGIIGGFIEELLPIQYRMNLDGNYDQFWFEDINQEGHKLHASVKKGNSELLNRVNRGLGQITHTEWENIERKWVKNNNDRVYSVGSNIHITPEEQEWLDNHPVIHFGAINDWPPYEYVDIYGTYRGIYTDLVLSAIESLGLEYEIHFEPWDDVLNGIKTKKYDVSVTLAITDERSKYMVFTDPLFSIDMVSVRNTEVDIVQNYDDLYGKTVAIERGYYLTETYEQMEGLDLLYVSSVEEALIAVSGKRADVYVGSKHPVLYTLDNISISNIRMNNFKEKDDRTFAVGFRDDYYVLRNLVQKYIDELSEGEIKQLYNNYISFDPDVDFEMTEEIRQTLSTFPSIRVGLNKEYAPYTMESQDQVVGIVPDYLQEISVVIEKEFLPFNSDSEDQLVRLLQSGELDIIAATTKKQSLSDKMLFTNPYMSHPIVVMSNKGAQSVYSVKDILDKDVYIHEQSPALEYLQKEYVQINIIPVASVQEGLKVVDDSTNAVFVGNISVINYELASGNYDNIILSYITSYQHELVMGVSLEHPELIVIMNNALRTISDRDRDAIVEYWTTNIEQVDVNWDGVLRIVIIFSVISAAVILAILYWNRRLSKEVDSRKKAQDQLSRNSTLLSCTSDISRYFVQEDLEHLDEVVEFLLEKVNEVVDVDVISLFIYNGDKEVYYMEGEAAKSEDLLIGDPISRVRLSEMQVFHDALANQGEVLLQSLVFFPEEMARIKGLVLERDMKSMYSFSLSQDQNIFGFINFCHYKEEKQIDEDMKYIYMRIKELLANAIAKKEMSYSLFLSKESADLANKSKSEFLANMSHEIRTPMNAVVGMADLVAGTPLTYKQKDYITKIKQASFNLLGIINDILDFSKIEAGKLEIEHIDFDLDDILSNISNMMAIKAQKKNIEIIVDRKERVPRHLIGDPLRINQVILNLMNNAVKFTESGKIRLSVDVEVIDKEMRKLIVSVSDTGIGMSEEQLDKLFKPFTQSESSTTRKFGGTGLGLSICKMLVEMMGGSIEAQCSLGQGCDFTFDVVVRKQEGIDIEYKDAFSGHRGLVMNSDDEVMLLISRYLRRLGIEVDNADTVEHALEEIIDHDDRGQAYDFIVVDWDMRDMNGVDFISSINQSSELSKVPKSILTLRYGLEKELELKSSHFIDRIVMKPVTLSGIYDALVECFDLNIASSVEVEKDSDYYDGTHVLVVEDNFINQQVAVELLKSRGITSDIAEDGKMAVDMIREQGSIYDIILMDIQMPVMDGYESTRQIRLLDEHQDIPIVAMTADAIKGVKEACLEAGMNDYITKPIDVTALFNTISKWVERSEKEDDQMIIPGLDTKQALSKLGDNEKLYSAILSEYCETYEHIEDELSDLYQKENIKELRLMVHTIKGINGTIGNYKLAESSRSLEASLKDEIMPDWSEFKVLADRIKKTIQAIQDSEYFSDPSTKEHEATQIVDDLVELGLALNAFKPIDAKSYLKKLRYQDISQTYTENIEIIATFVENYEFKEAAIAVEKLVDMLKERGNSEA